MTSDRSYSLKVIGPVKSSFIATLAWDLSNDFLKNRKKLHSLLKISLEKDFQKPQKNF